MERSRTAVQVIRTEIRPCVTNFLALYDIEQHFFSLIRGPKCTGMTEANTCTQRKTFFFRNKSFIPKIK